MRMNEELKSYIKIHQNSFHGFLGRQQIGSTFVPASPSVPPTVSS
jgi:hypothetical protein